MLKTFPCISSHQQQSSLNRKYEVFLRRCSQSCWRVWTLASQDDLLPVGPHVHVRDEVDHHRLHGTGAQELFCEYNGCTDYQEFLVKGNIKDKLENYTDIFPNTTKYYGENTTTFAAELSINYEEEELKKDLKALEDQDEGQIINAFAAVKVKNRI